MNKKKISLALTAIAITLASGCVPTRHLNVTNFGNERYSEIISKSKNHQELKEYLIKNNMKLGTIVSLSNSATGGLSNIVLDGQRVAFTSATNNQWLKAIMGELVISELSGLLLDVAGYTLSYCGDYNHATIAENGSFGKMEFTYFLSNITEEQRQILFKAAPISDCSLDGFLGDVLYKKKLQISSSPSNAKLSLVFAEKSQSVTSDDNLNIVLKDMSAQAMAAMLTDTEMLQALKDYRLTGGKKTPVEQPSKTTITEPMTTPPSTNQSVNLDSFKTQCKELGFKVGTADYGNCVLQLMK